jgi:TonB family protein
MSTAAMTLGTRPRLRLGPALRRAHLPFGSLALSAIAHAVMVGVMVGAAMLWPTEKTKTYVVNLVPAVAAVGSPQGRPTPRDEPRRTVPTPVEKSSAKELPPPSRETSRQLPPLSRDTGRDLPPAPRDTAAALPERALPTRTPALPRAGDKELPAVARAPMPRPAPPAPAPAATTTPAPPPPPPPSAALGQVTGSAQGAGAVTLNVSDFPYAWYIQAIHRKIQERWEGRAIQGRQPEIIFEIGRDGQVRRLGVGKTSGNPSYDQLAMRAIADANPFPPLPEGFDKPVLTIGLQFVYDASAR